MINFFFLDLIIEFSTARCISTWRTVDVYIFINVIQEIKKLFFYETISW